MNRRLVLFGGLVLLAGVVAAFVYFRRAPARTEQEATALAAGENAIPGPSPLANVFEAPGIVSKRLGSLRLYVSVQSEIPIRKTSPDQSQDQMLERVPIRVVLENETYKPLTMRDVTSNAEVFTVKVMKDGSEIFSAHQLSSEITEWKPAERKNFTIEWPLQEAVAGNYLITVTTGFGDRDTVQIRTSLK